MSHGRFSSLHVPIILERTPAERFERLASRVQSCWQCPRMEGRCRVLGVSNGPLVAKVLFLAEAPGRLGADRTGSPLSGDQSGRNFDRLLAAAGLSRDAVFITNAVLCNPRDARGRNSAPSQAELRNCSHFLAATIGVVDAPIIVSLGAVALRALDRLYPHGLALASDVAVAVAWQGRALMPLYHPSPRAQLHRAFSKQVEDFEALGMLVAHGDVPHHSSRFQPVC